jgi:hypothetical protein
VFCEIWSRRASQISPTAGGAPRNAYIICRERTLSVLRSGIQSFGGRKTQECESLSKPDGSHLFGVWWRRRRLLRFARRGLPSFVSRIICPKTWLKNSLPTTSPARFSRSSPRKAPASSRPRSVA